jgi:hypothetical protein
VGYSRRVKCGVFKEGEVWGIQGGCSVGYYRRVKWYYRRVKW